MKDLLIRLWKEEEGQDLTEYALLLMGIAFLSIVSIKNLALLLNNLFVSATTQLQGVTQ